MATATALKVPHLQPNHWIQAGIARLASDGIESVRIELLARDLRVSKGSFYWHFRDREDLLGKILAHWETDERNRLEPAADDRCLAMGVVRRAEFNNRARSNGTGDSDLGAEGRKSRRLPCHGR